MINKEIIYNYDVFISYRHVDEDIKWAKWLLESLETWRVPKELVKKGFPERIGRVFRDEEELPTSANLSKSIQKALIQSKYLVVICSKDTPKSIWVENEIKMFKELGRSDRIIALLIEGETEESFNKELKFKDGIETPLEILIADARKKDNQKDKEIKKNILLTILSAVLACSFEELENGEKIREQNKKRNTIILLLFIFILLITSGILIWNHNKIQKNYYSNFVYQYGIPKGIVPLDKKQCSKKGIYYIFETKNNILKRVKRVNSYGILKDDEENFNVSILIPEIDIYGCIKRITYKDHNNKIVMIKEYSPDLKIIEFQNEFNLPFIFEVTLL